MSACGLDPGRSGSRTCRRTSANQTQPIAKQCPKDLPIPLGRMRFRKRESRGDRRSLRSSRATVGSGGPRAACAAASRCVCVSGQGRFKGNARAKPRARRARQAEGRAAESLSRADGPGDAPVHLGGSGRKRRTHARFTSGMACRRAPAKDLGADCCPQRAVRPHRLSRRELPAARRSSAPTVAQRAARSAPFVRTDCRAERGEQRPLHSPHHFACRLMPSRAFAEARATSSKSERPWASIATTPRKSTTSKCQTASAAPNSFSSETPATLFTAAA